MSAEGPDLFSIAWTPRGPAARIAFAAAKPLLERAFGLTELARVYRARPPASAGADFAAWTLDFLGIEVRVSDADLARIPAKGPVVVVANHPFGGVEGVALLHALRRMRPDAKILANFLLGRIAELRDHSFFVDPFVRPGHGSGNVAGLRLALAWLRGGGLLIVFPAGEVASLDRRSGRVADPPWSPTVAGLIRRSGATAVPVFIPGRNGALFQAAGLVHPMLRTALLPRALLARTGRPIDLRVGTPVPAARLSELEDDALAIAYLRDRTEILEGRAEAGPAPVQPRRTPDGAEPIVPAVPSELLAEEIGALPAEARLVVADELEVYVSRAPAIPLVLREIGRLRETTFREVGEGTGRAIDLDAFDHTYLHLFVWNRAAREIVGAYRLGLTDELLAAGGVDALYTASLFRFDPKLFAAMGPAIEMGRSFIRVEYQKSYAGLMLLWRGIGEFVARDLRHATLFGPVSISSEYRSLSQSLIVAFLERNRKLADWARFVRPTNPFRPRRAGGAPRDPGSLRDLEDVSSFISEIEADQKGVPVLLKQYLKLDGRLLSYNVDPDFSGVLDVLIVVDLRRTRDRILKRYLGAEGLAAFRAHHADRKATTQAS
jgi:putative hemolysin